ncbi:hypothetical protein FVF58_46645 [Paraburkholderia panacisoli]|uniref:Glycosyl hydrolase 94 catalytic domain-containing protein n=1 Tax=Paraburkholderia panacisoli TaxID=2603818 RepID=A0A5B0G5F6_9BURK|nr:hypothetical protein FVF58_46645 [Paraburkholderia panacisoli]
MPAASPPRRKLRRAPLRPVHSSHDSRTTRATWCGRMKRRYPPGVRENGGQYTHAAMWSVLAFADMGDGDRAAELFAMLNPVNRSRTRSGVNRYKVEPYVVAADVDSVAPHMGRGGWTWYTGSAGWMYRAAMEGVLCICKQGDALSIDPCVPRAWPSFTAAFR